MASSSSSSRKPLTAKQQRFVAEYLFDRNAKQAAIRAGYSAKTAETCGPRLLRNAQIAQAVAQKAQGQLRKLDITAERVLAELGRLAFSDLRNLFDEHGRLKPISELSDEAAAALASVEVLRARTAADGEAVTDESVIKVKAWDKPRALDMLAKHFGLLTDRVEVTGPGGGPLETVTRIERVVIRGSHAAIPDAGSVSSAPRSASV